MNNFRPVYFFLRAAHALPRHGVAAAMTLSLLLLSAGTTFAQQRSGSAGSGTTGVSSSQSTTTFSTPLANESMQYPGEDFHLSPGDLISVRIYGELDYQPVVRVGLDGSVILPYIGNLSLQGLTIRDSQNLIAERLRAGGFYTHPEISILVMESLNGAVTIAGEVKAVVPISGARRLIDVISAGGGLPAAASHTVRIIRPGVDKPIVVNLGADLSTSTDANLLVYPRDIIQVSRAGVVYTLGAFGRQGSTPLDQATPLTLMQLTALSGGIGFEGRFSELRIIRTVGVERKVVEVDVKKVIRGQAPDPILEANDIIYLPSNATKAVLKSLGIGGVIGLVSLAASLRYY